MNTVHEWFIYSWQGCFNISHFGYQKRQTVKQNKKCLQLQDKKANFKTPSEMHVFKSVCEKIGTVHKQAYELCVWQTEKQHTCRWETY